MRILARLIPMGSAARTMIVEDIGTLGDLVIRTPAYQWLGKTPAVASGERLLVVRFIPIETKRGYRKVLLYGFLRANLAGLRGKFHSEQVLAEHEFLANNGCDSIHFDRDLFRYSFLYRVLVICVLRRMGVRRHIILSTWRPLFHEGLRIAISPPEILLFGTDRLPSLKESERVQRRQLTGVHRQAVSARAWLARHTPEFTETPSIPVGGQFGGDWTYTSVHNRVPFFAINYLSCAYEAIAAWHALPPPAPVRLSVDTRLPFALHKGDYAVLAPGSTGYRRLNNESWAMLIAALHNAGTRLVLCTSVVRMPVLSEIFSLLPTEVQSGIFVQPPFINTLVFGQLLRDARYVVCEDTGTFHLSCVTGSKTIVLCDPESQLGYLPYPDVLVPPDRQHVIGMTLDQLRTHDAAFMAAEVIPAVRTAIEHRICDN